MFAPLNLAPACPREHDSTSLWRGQSDFQLKGVAKEVTQNRLYRRLTTIAGFALLALSGAWDHASAQAIPAQPPVVRYSIRASDAVVAGAVGVVAALPIVMGKSLPYARCNPCDASHLWPIDRGTVGLPHSGIGNLSTLTMGATALGAGLLVGRSHRGEPDARAATREDFAVMAEALEIDYMLTTWSKVLTQRARPVLYTSASGQNQTADAGRSFPSGHASFSFAAAASAASILHRRGELGRHKAEVILLFAGAAATSALRVAAHKHFPTDVVAGAVLGTAVGWVTPRLHPVR